MSNQEAKFILGAYRPDGRDAGDPMFAGPLTQAEQDPELRAWFERQRKFDSAVAGKLREVAPPAELRDAILAGVRASRPRRNWWMNPAWLAAAAAIVVLGAVTISIVPAAGRSSAGELATFALNDLATSHDQHVGHPPELAEVQARLADARLPLTGGLGIDLEELQRKNCRSVRVAGHEVFEICFQRHDGTWFHLYAARRKDFSKGSLDPNTLMTTRGDYASTAWADSKNVYALVTRAGPAALRKLF